jgi:calcineurin-like phosphoesterase family protein
MKFWITADFHMGHALMAEYCGRPAGYEWKILKALANNIKPEDILIHLGDICWHDDEKWHNE